MATGTVTAYGKGVDAMIKGDLDLNAGTFKWGLASSSYTPDADSHDFWNDVSANEVTGTNWSAGGQTATLTFDQDTTNNRIRVFVADISVATVTVSDAKHGVLYKDTGTPGTSALVFYVTFDTALSPTAGTLAFDFDNTNGALRFAY